MEICFPTSAQELGDWLGVEVIGDKTAPIHSLAPLSQAKEGTLSFCSGRQYESILNRLKGAVILTKKELVREDLPITFIVVQNPQTAFVKMMRVLSQKKFQEGISALASIHPSAVVPNSCFVGPYAVISEGAKLGDNTSIHAFSYIGPDVQIGSQCEIFPHVVLLDRVKIGNEVTIFPGAVLGADGFSIIPDPVTGELSQAPQLGSVVIGDRVRIGANCTIDRGSIGDTVIESGTKMDDQVHIGHNVQIGKNCILCAQVGLAGSVVLEDEVVLGGQVGAVDHVRVGKKARVGGQAGIGSHLEGERDYSFTPAVPVNEGFRSWKALRRLPDLIERIKKLEEKVKDL